MIPDNILEACLNSTDAEILRTCNNEKNKNFEDMRAKISKNYDLALFNCLHEKNYAHLLEPDNKADLTTTKIELRKAECLNKCKNYFNK